VAPPPSNQQQAGAPLRDDRGARPTAEPRTPHRQETPRRQRAPERLTEITNEQLQDDDDIMSEDSGADSKIEALSQYYEAENYTIKENVPLSGRRRFVDRQVNAERVAWSQQSEEDSSEPETNRHGKRPRHATADEDEDEDDAFQQDDRPVDQSKRRRNVRSMVAAHGHRSSAPALAGRQESIDLSEPVASLPKTHEGRRQERTQNISPVRELPEDALEDERLQASARAADDDPPPTAREVNEAARLTTAIARRTGGLIRPQQRQRWSEDETEHLINMIARHGCSWSNLIKIAGDGFSANRDQGSLKDKARNLKVDFLL
jgi:hypothetical protein